MPASTQILRASAYAIDDLATAFTRGFEQYLVPHAMTPAAMAERVLYQDVNLDGSFVLQADDGPAGLALLSVRGERSWCCALAVAAAHRGEGYGRTLMEQLIAEARSRKLRQMWLEVFTQNTAAFQLYQSLGFQIERELTDYVGPLAHGVAQRAFTGPLLLSGLSDDAGEGEDLMLADRTPVEIEAAAALLHYAELEPVRPSWEFEQSVLERLASAGRLRSLAIPGEDGDAPDAYLLYEERPTEIRLLAFGTRSGADVSGGLELATVLLGALSRQHPGARYNAEEIPPGNPLGPVLEAAGCPAAQRLFEMVLAL